MNALFDRLYLVEIGRCKPLTLTPTLSIYCNAKCKQIRASTLNDCSGNVTHRRHKSQNKQPLNFTKIIISLVLQGRKQQIGVCRGMVATLEHYFSTVMCHNSVLLIATLRAEGQDDQAPSEGPRGVRTLCFCRVPRVRVVTHQDRWNFNPHSNTSLVSLLIMAHGGCCGRVAALEHY